MCLVIITVPNIALDSSSLPIRLDRLTNRSQPLRIPKLQVMIRGRHSLFSCGTRYFYRIGPWAFILYISAVLYLCGFSVILFFISIASIVYWYWNIWQKLSGLYSDTFNAILRYRNFCKKYRQFCIVIQKCPAVVMMLLETIYKSYISKNLRLQTVWRIVLYCM